MKQDLLTKELCNIFSDLQLDPMCIGNEDTCHINRSKIKHLHRLIKIIEASPEPVGSDQILHVLKRITYAKNNAELSTSTPLHCLKENITEPMPEEAWYSADSIAKVGSH